MGRDCEKALIQNAPLTTGAQIYLPQFRSVSNKGHFPPAVNGVITLESNTTYLIAGTIDLMGDRIQCSENTSFLGASPELAILKSTGFDDEGGAFLTSEYSVPLFNIAFHNFSTEQVLDIDGDGNTAALDWFGVNFLNCSNVGTIANVSNFIANTLGFLNSSGLTFDGTIGTISFADTLFENASGSTSITIPETMTITRRFRIIYSSFITLSGETSLNVSASATIPDEGYILHDVNFSGGGTYLSGINHTSEKARFGGCRGISNTATVGHMYMQNNATGTAATTADTFYKIAGTTTAGTTIEKFTHTSNRLTYTGALSGFFEISASLNCQASLNTSFSFRIAKGGNTSADGEITIRTQSNTDYMSCMVQDVIELTTGDYIEVFGSASQNSATILVADMNVLIKRLTT